MFEGPFRRTLPEAIQVMHGETAAVATCSRRLVREKEAGRLIRPVIETMNKLAQKYPDVSRPLFCAENGLVDEIVDLGDLRKYLVAFTGAANQNLKSICPHNHMILPRIIKG